MGHKTHPYGFRLGIIKDWKTHWYANNSSAYRNLVQEDLRLRNSIYQEYQNFSDAGISRVEIDRGAQDSVINIHSARPGILIGRDGERVKQLRAKLEGITRRRIQLNIMEIEHPELDPYLVGRNIADQIQRRVAYRRAMRQAAQRAMQAGAQGIKIIVKGRIAGAEIARTEKLMMGQVPLHTLR
ncbi:MAG TPA: 30S ribosomal protein S3, partial [Dehalococcoidia bacterium]|nr:30S ribosomal protein S3 [Dehalococcoidia bacterium]